MPTKSANHGESRFMSRKRRFTTEKPSIHALCLQSSVGKPLTIDGNGALGPVGGTNYSYDDNANTAVNRFAFLYGDPDMDKSPVAYPCAALIAATMNDELAYDLGSIIGEDCLWAGYSGLYGFGCNMHRGTYNGRAFEYYSEDPLLSGYK